MITLFPPHPGASCWSWSPLGNASSAPAAAAAAAAVFPLEVTAAAAAFLGSAFSLCFDLIAGVAGPRPFAAEFGLLVPPGVHPTLLLRAASPVLAAFTPLTATPVPPGLEALRMALAMFCTAADELFISLAERGLGSGLIGRLDRVTG